MPNDPATTVSQVIRDRRTAKVFADEPQPAVDMRDVVADLLDAASWAPFHYPAAKAHQDGAVLPSKLPWRFYVLDGAACRSLRDRLIAVGDTGKLPKMLAAAAVLIQATWLPNPPRATVPADLLFDPTAENMENLAAASAAVQNALLAATARGIPNYWSSGGRLRDRPAFDWLGIPHREVLLGSIFLFPPGSENGPNVEGGKLRDQRGAPRDWSRWITLD